MNYSYVMFYGKLINSGMQERKEQYIPHINISEWT